MYTNESTKALQASTIQLLNETKQSKISAADIDALRQALRFHEYRYYIMNDPLISDGEYDLLFKQLEKLEASDPTIITADSPTQRVAKGLTKDFPAAPHLVPMLSLDNSYNAEDLLDFDRKAR